MSGACYASGINPWAIPGEELAPDVVEAAADTLTRDAAKIRQFGSDVLGHWQRLPQYYEAPEAGQLFAAMDPVAAKSETVAAAVTAVARALRGYAEEIRPITHGLAVVRSDAWAFRARIDANSEWEYDQSLVDENSDLLRRVNAFQVALWDAERRCANAIRAQYGAAPWHAADGSDDGLAYGVTEIPTDAPMAWGSEVQRKDHCPKAAGVQVTRFVWDGVIVDGLWGGVTGLGTLIGIDGSGWHWDTMKTSWVGLGALIGYAEGEWSWGNAGEGWKALGKGLVAWDTWEDDPGRAAGGAVFNILTVVVPVGAAVGGAKGAATAAGTAGKVGRFFIAADKLLAFTDPVSVGLMGTRVALPRLADLAGGLTENLDVLAHGFELDELAGLRRALADLDVGTPDLDVPTTSLDDLPDVQVRDPDLPAASPSGSTPVDNLVDDLTVDEVPEPAMVGGDGPGTGSSGTVADDIGAGGTHAPDADPTPTDGSDVAGPPLDVSAGSGDSGAGGSTSAANPDSWPFDLTDPEQVYQHAFHNMDSDVAVLGRFEEGSPTSYEAVAKAQGAAYFELGTEGGIDLWESVRDANGFTSNADLFDALNAPFLDDILVDNKTIVFTHDPLAAPKGSFLATEYDYIFRTGPFVGSYRWEPSVGVAGAAVPVSW